MGAEIRTKNKYHFKHDPVMRTILMDGGLALTILMGI